MKMTQSNYLIKTVWFFTLLMIFNCKKEDVLENITLPSLTTNEITDITANSATSGGDITDDGGSEILSKGVCWNSSPNPTVYDFATDEGANPSNFTSILTNLVTGQTYYVRAYATNSKGIAYGNELSFIAQNVFLGETVLVEGGTFVMGNPNGVGNPDTHPQHDVTVDSFSISKYEITNAEYVFFLNKIGANSDGSFGGVEYIDMDDATQIIYFNNQFMVDTGNENHPVMEVSWYGAKAFSEYYGGRLPTEAEWEFAARGGNSSNGYIYSGSNNADDVAWYYNGEYGNPTHAVGTKIPNELGLYDMSGNVYEWCNDWYDWYYYSNSPILNPQGPNTGSIRVLRGGSWYNQEHNCTVAVRYGYEPVNTYNYLGFRPVFSIQ